MFNVFKNNCSLFVLLTWSAKTVFYEKNTNCTQVAGFCDYICVLFWFKSNLKDFTCMFSTCFYNFYLSVSWDQLATSLASLYYSRLTLLKQRKEIWVWNASFTLCQMLGMHPLNCPGHRLDSHCPFLIFIHFPLQSLFVREAGVVRQPRCSDIHFACLLEKNTVMNIQGIQQFQGGGKKMEGSKKRAGQNCSFVLILSASVMEGSSSEANSLL